MFSLLLAAAPGLKGPMPRLERITTMAPAELLRKMPAAAAAASVALHAELAHAKSIQGINGALDFGPLAGDQPGGEGTGKALGINDDSLFFALGAVVLTVGVLFAQWQGYQVRGAPFAALRWLRAASAGGAARSSSPPPPPRLARRLRVAPVQHAALPAAPGRRR
jgi:hypothetical protein